MRTAWLPLAVLLARPALALAGEPAETLRVVSPKPIGIIATAINGRGDIVGFEWVEEEPDILSQKPFIARGAAMTYLPLLEGYTATFPADVSDEGLVVGRVGKAAPPGVRVPLRNQAFAWEAATGIVGLGALEGDWASIASGVSRDGRRISGISVGDDRTRACVWERVGEGWAGRVLPQQHKLGSNIVAISNDGRRIAAVDGDEPCLWTLGPDGNWVLMILGGPGSMIPRAVNDKGVVVGIRHPGDGNTQAIVWESQGGFRTIPMPLGYVKAEAADVNGAGVVVGFIDSPNGSDVGPNAFVYRDGRIRLISEGGPNFGAATAINDRGEVAGVLEESEGPAGPGR